MDGETPNKELRSALKHHRQYINQNDTRQTKAIKQKTSQLPHFKSIFFFFSKAMFTHNILINKGVLTLRRTAWNEAEELEGNLINRKRKKRKVKDKR